uniref:SH3 domain-containing protein n=1 Tax=Gasterosteus aculeatus aculeatus TaxID=481459 RepID=A0AAQ4QDS6_GASAC
MAFSQTCTILWGTCIVLVILPHFSLGLLSDYKICGDTECESLLSRAQATRDHQGKDCRFLSFRRGETIFVYQKLTGKREDLWAGSVSLSSISCLKQSLKSDFFCIDEFGYFIDSSHLDDDADDDQKNQVSETTQTSPFPRATSTESPSTSEEASTGSPVSAVSTPAEEDEGKSADDAASRSDEGARETPAALREQGGSAPSSSWLGSSVTGWLGLAEEDEGGKKEETTENRAKVVSSLPDDIRPGPDLYGLSWEPVIVSSLVGLVTMLLFTCRCYSSVSTQLCMLHAQTTLKVYSMNSDRLQGNLGTAGEESALLQESNAQLRQQVEGWAERVSELEAEMSRCEVAHGAMLQDVATKDERIMSLTDRLLGMKGWDSDLEEEEAEAGGQKENSNGRAEANGKAEVKDTQGHLQKVQKLIYAAKLNADLKAVDEDKDRLFAKLSDEVKAKEELQESIREMNNDKLSLQSDSEQYQDQVQRLQQKLQIMTEMYQENELKLHRLLTVEEKERLQKEEKLNKADKNIALAMEELSNYRQRAGEMEEELEKTKQSYQTQISAHEKKAHNNWLAARAADRDLADIRRENTQGYGFALTKLPLALSAERSPYSPSPLGRPASETRAFLSPPTLMDGPPARLSPRGELERSGGPHSDSGSISPTWERDRRGPPPGPPGPLGPPGVCV